MEEKSRHRGQTHLEETARPTRVNLYEGRDHNWKCTGTGCKGAGHPAQAKSLSFFIYKKGTVYTKDPQTISAKGWIVWIVNILGFLFSLLNSVLLGKAATDDF